MVHVLCAWTKSYVCECYSVQVKYYLDPLFMKPGEVSMFLSHLTRQVLHIDVWDGDSLLLIGSCSVDMKVSFRYFIFFFKLYIVGILCSDGIDTVFFLCILERYSPYWSSTIF